uniref:Flap endonuclease GEN homolog 1 n=1 Tax=Ciona intestinalis TaxID=7719 RepID=F6ZYE8_CIOIN|nr:flap endonuclease GEN homolog 1 [Ciona intestinalis]|eukprot:XP_002124511.2 flap endonuclease GEN homolog 1 [Ciona intestinalis]
MGVQGLWDILQEVKTTKKLCDLKDRTYAVDLATWICEAESVAALKHAIAKPYLRNLFFRVITFTRNGTRLIFVTDGKAPELKWKTMAHRMDVRQEVQKGTNVSHGSRSRLNARFNECCQLLDQLGIPWIKSEGEAEATCAALNSVGVVDGCMTNDSDTFLYGAKSVYRNLSMTTDRNDIDVECYELCDIESKLQLNRKSLIALGLLLGCDYSPQGVPGVGKKQAIMLLSSWKNIDPLEKLKAWKSESVLSPTVTKKPTHCSACSHIGSKRDHKKNGCDICGSECGSETALPVDCSCEWHVLENEQRKHNLENGIKKKALLVENFPDPKIIREFTRNKLGSQPLNHLSPRQPTLFGAVQYLCEKLEWQVKYAVDKVLPLLTYWLMQNEGTINEISFQRIVRTRIKDRVPSFEVKWFLSGIDDVTEAVTLEPQELVTKKFPEASKNFFAEQQAKKKKTKSKGAKQQKIPAAKMTDFYKITKTTELTSKPLITKGNDLKNTSTTPTAANTAAKNSEISPIQSEYVKNDLKRSSRPTSSCTVVSKSNDDDDVIFVSESSPAKQDLDVLHLIESVASFKITSDESEPVASPVSVSQQTLPFRDLTNARETETATKTCELTFPDESFDINFSLGGLHTPCKATNPHSVDDSFDLFSRSPLQPTSTVSNVTKPSPAKSQVSASPVTPCILPPKSPPSPVFMTLAERLRLRASGSSN